MSPLIRASIVSLSCAFVACHASYPTAASEAAPIALQVQYSGAVGRVRPGSGQSFRAYSLDSDGAYELVTAKASWTSSDPSVMRPTSATSTFVAAGPGAARITAHYEGLEASLWMVVIDPQLVQTFPVLSLFAAQPAQIGGRASVSAFLQQRPNGPLIDVRNRVTWTSADTRVATINENGLITAIEHGTTLITASLDGLTEWFWVSVPPRP